MHRIGPHPLDQKATDGILEDLVAIAARLADPMAWYWSTLKQEAAILVQQARKVQSTLGRQNVVESLLKTLENPPANHNQDFDTAYWLVKLLHSRRGYPQDVEKLTKEYDATHNLEKTFKVGDDLGWERLTSEVDSNSIELGLADSAETQESLRPIKFALSFNNPALAESYLVRNVLSYEWQFTETPSLSRGWFRRKASDGSATRPKILNGPRITDYARSPGKLQVSTTILRWVSMDDCKKTRPVTKTIDICKNSELTLLQKLDFSNLALTLIVGGVALATILPTLYFAKATFGSLADYVAILVWAVGIDQGKNLIQLLKSYPADRPAAGANP